MKILITSGGTKVPIDAVRDITNMSSGTFGAKLAKAALEDEHEVHFFYAKDSKSPFFFQQNFAALDINSTDPSNMRKSLKWMEWVDWCIKHRPLYKETTYRNFDDYASGLERIITEEKPDAVILAAAVSDYVTKAATGKVRTKDNMNIALEPAEKLIGKVKKWHPDTILVGFKLLVGATDQELIMESRKSITNNRCSLVIANDLNSLKAGNHRLLAVSDWYTDTIDKDQAERVIDLTEENYLNFIDPDGDFK